MKAHLLIAACSIGAGPCLAAPSLITNYGSGPVTVVAGEADFSLPVGASVWIEADSLTVGGSTYWPRFSESVIWSGTEFVASPSPLFPFLTFAERCIAFLLIGLGSFFCFAFWRSLAA